MKGKQLKDPIIQHFIATFRFRICIVPPFPMCRLPASVSDGEKKKHKARREVLLARRETEETNKLEGEFSAAAASLESS